MIAVCAVMALCVCTACAGNAGNNQDNNQNNAQNTQQTPQQNNQQNVGSTQNAQTGGITIDKAKEIALADSGVNAASANFVKTEIDYDNGIRKYEVEFIFGQNKYEYDINADTGAIMKKEIDSTNDD